MLSLAEMEMNMNNIIQTVEHCIVISIRGSRAQCWLDTELLAVSMSSGQFHLFMPCWKQIHQAQLML